MQSTTERDLLKLEREYWQAIKEKDVEAMNRLTDFPCIVTGPQGIASIDEKTFTAMAKSDTSTLKEFSFDGDAEVRMLSDDVATIAYKVREKLTVEGKPVTLDAAEASVWVRRNGAWKCAMHSEAISGDPWGRDRKAVH